MKKFILAIFLIAIALASINVEVKAINASTVTLTLGSNENNPTQYPADAYSLVTLNETMLYNDIESITYPSDGLVGVQIQDPNGNTIVIRTLSTGNTVPYNIPASISQAYLSNGQEQQISSISIPSQSNPIIPMFYFTVANNLNTMQSMLVTLNVFDSNGVPIAEASQLMSGVPAYSSEGALVDFNIPSWAHYGTAYAYVDVYNTLPSQGGYPLGEEYSFQFTITGATAFQGIRPTTQSLNGDPTNYFSMTFRLPQYTDLTLGKYTAYSSTNYQSIAGSQTTTFGVAELADVNGDGVVNFNDITTFVGLYINYFTNHVYSPQIDFIHNGSVINFNDVALFVGYYIQAWSS
jgi:hypothetical protein